jgi:hypothetical protein
MTPQLEEAVVLIINVVAWSMIAVGAAVAVAYAAGVLMGLLRGVLELRAMWGRRGLRATAGQMLTHLLLAVVVAVLWPMVAVGRWSLDVTGRA